MKNLTNVQNVHMPQFGRAALFLMRGNTLVKNLINVQNVHMPLLLGAALFLMRGNIQEKNLINVHTAHMLQLLREPLLSTKGNIPVKNLSNALTVHMLQLERVTLLSTKDYVMWARSLVCVDNIDILQPQRQTFSIMKVDILKFKISMNVYFLTVCFSEKGHFLCH